MKILLLVLSVSLAGNTLLAAGLDFEDLRRIESDGVKVWTLTGVAAQASVHLQRYVEQDSISTKEQESLPKDAGRVATPQADKPPENKGVQIIHLSR